MTARPTIILDSIGSFHVGGRRVSISGEEKQQLRLSADLPSYDYDPNGTYAIDQAYVAFYIPVDSLRLPVLFVHGGGLTGAMWESTPDGRPGWLTHFLRRGHPCYVIDNVERGRAGWCTVPGEWEGAPVTRTEEEAWTAFRIGQSHDYERRIPFQNSQFPVNSLENLTKQSVPRWLTSNNRAIAALCEAVKKIGRCVLIAHSHGGGISAHTVQKMPLDVAATVLLEPHGLPDAKGLHRTEPQVIYAGDNIDSSALYRPLMKTWTEYIDTASEQGTTAQLIKLNELGYVGNTHNMMMDLNSESIALEVLNWLDQRLP